MHRSSPGTRSSPRRTGIARVFCSSDRATACVQHAAPMGRRKMKALRLSFVAIAASAPSAALGEGRGPLAHTYSIVARDPKTGELGVAVQSHWFSVGTVVPWAEAGVGAVATQSFVDPSYGKLGLDLMRAGRSAPDTLKSLVAGDDGRDVRQVAMIDTQGRVAAHTGAKCIDAAGHHVGKDYSVQANMMLNERVWPAMSRAFEE